MSVRLTHSLLFVCATAAFVFAQTDKGPPKVSVCELASHPEQYDGKKVTVQGEYSNDWLRGEWISSAGCSDRLRFGLPGSPWVPKPYSELTVEQDSGFKQFQTTSQLVCDHSAPLCGIAESILAEFTGTFVAEPHLKETSATVKTDAHALIVTRIGGAAFVGRIVELPQLPERPAAGNAFDKVPGLRSPPLSLPDEIPTLPVPQD